MSFTWDAQTYDRLPLPHEQWGAGVIARAEIQDDCTILDLGCGTGRDSLTIATAYPSSTIYAIDQSPTMLGELASKKADNYPNLHLIQSDLTANYSHLVAQAEVAISVAALHWISDHRSVFRQLSAVLKPGGRLSFECGGSGNIAHVRSALRHKLGSDYHDEHWNFATVETERALLESCGFDVSLCVLRDDPTPPMDHDTFRNFLGTLVLAPYTKDLPQAERDVFIGDVADQLPREVVDYVRLEVVATYLGH